MVLVGDYQLARTVSSVGSPRHVPRTLLRVMAVAARPVQPQLARLARAAVVMDTAATAALPEPSVTTAGVAGVHLSHM
ncbi:hypothetical protein SAMN05216199_1506 [Pedococcus cremeus]|uniref:Uncharacterized protein n=1 Tax=Pedococcus cremeus TaxID=587636 RepID=A0A1H9TAQ8_9MICO|nr:hypothetical protein [Pedococcus cremeus]SER94034.1 hypothetical protein SAMN05216199_1506 [Pedococcus cremeus]